MVHGAAIRDGAIAVPGGRPSSYDPSYCERIVELGREGLSIVQMAAALDVHRETIEQNWPAAYPEFSEAFAFARLLSQAWWEAKGQDSLDKPVFQGSVWSRSMAARFPKDWREKTETDVNIKGDLAALIAERRAKVAEAE